MSSKSLSVQVAIQAVVNLTSQTDFQNFDQLLQSLRDTVYALEAAINTTDQDNIYKDLFELSSLYPLILLKSVQLCQFEFVYHENEIENVQKKLNDIEEFATKLTVMTLKLCETMIVNSKLNETEQKIYLSKPKRCLKGPTRQTRIFQADNACFLRDVLYLHECPENLTENDEKSIAYIRYQTLLIVYLLAKGNATRTREVIQFIPGAIQLLMKSTDVNEGLVVKILLNLTDTSKLDEGELNHFNQICAFESGIELCLHLQ